MGNISSVNLKSSQKFNPWHNVDIRPPYAMLTDANNVNLFGINSLESLRLKEKMIKQAEENYKTHCKARNKAFQAKSYEWSAVVNLNETHTEKDLKKLVDYFANTHGFQCYQAVIHRDEGHLVENETGLVWQSAKHFFFDKETGIYYKGECKNPDAEIEKQIWKKSDEILAQNIDELKKQFEIKINHHAHLEFITLDKETGKNHFRGGLRTPKALSAMQTEVAKILGMNRGNNYYEAAKEAKEQGKKIVKPNRMDGRAYATINTNKNRKLSEQKEREKAQNNKIADLEAENENLKSKESQNTTFEKAFITLDTAFGVDFNKNISQSAQNYIDKFNEVAKERDLAKAEAKKQGEKRERTVKKLKATHATNKEIKAEFETKRKKWRDEKNKTKADYDALSALKKDCLAKRNLTIEQVREYIENLEKKLDEQRAAENEQAQKIQDLEKERDELRSELNRAQQENAQYMDKNEKLERTLNDANDYFNDVLQQEKAKRDEEWRQYLDERLAERDEYWQQQIAKLKNQNELPTNAQNDSSNVIHRKK